MNRRRFLEIAALTVGSTSLWREVSADPFVIEPVKAPTFDATPMPNLPMYSGPVNDLWDQPWLLEGKLVEVKGTILQRIVAPEGEGYVVSEDGLIFRSILHLKIPGGSGIGEVFVVSNDDFSALIGAHTAIVVGKYGGIGSDKITGYWANPIVIASSIQVPVN